MAISKSAESKKIPGRIASVRGSVVDIDFPEELPPINALLRSGEDSRAFIETTVHLDIISGFEALNEEGVSV